MNYGGDATARIPTGAGVTSNLDVDATTFVLGGGYTFAQTVLGGAHYTVAVFQPYTWLDISGLVDLPGGGGKVPLTPDYVVSRDRSVWMLRNGEGRVFSYPVSDPPCPT
jgi:hypothetical protein